MKFIEKHWKLVIVCLLGIILLQCCRGCNKRQQIMFKEVEVVTVRDSLEYVINEQKDSISILNSKLSELWGRNEQLNEANKSLDAAARRTIVIKTDN